MSASRPITVDTSLGANVLLFRRMSAREELGRLFEYELELLSENQAIALNSVVAKPMTVNVATRDGGTAHFNGIVTRFAQAPALGQRYAVYRATLRPSLWLLTRSAGCRIFQKKTAPEVIKAVFEPYGFPVEQKLSRTYPTREYCVQYRETDFDFVSRLMEEEGIYYFFRHASGKHTLVLVDAPNEHAAAKGYEELPYRPQLAGRTDDVDEITSWQVSEQLEPGACSLGDFDFLRPKASLLVKKQSSHPLAKHTYAIFDYPGRYVNASDGEALANIRLEELYAQQEVVEAGGGVRGLRAGDLFTLTEHTRSDQNRSHLVVSMTLEARVDDYESTGTTPTTGSIVSTSLRAIDSRRRYRSSRTTPQPVVRGPQTAIVVGASGKEIDTDQHGRVKLRFHWDPRTQEDEESSCWVRVSQQWAGAAWGAIDIPRIGQEVVVSFLEGDPDRPLVTGRVYNGVNVPPYALPGNMTQSGIKTRSTPSGNDTNFNELRFEDKKGSEQVFLQAEKDLEINVKNDETRTVGHDRKKTVKNDETTTVNGNRTETVDKDEKITIHGNRTETVDKDESITISGGRTESVDKDETVTISGNRTETVKKDESLTVQGSRTEKVSKDETVSISGARTQTVGKDESLTISGARTVSVSKDDSLSVDGKRSETVSKDASLTIQGKRAVSVTGDDGLDVKGKIELSSAQQLEIKVGAASLVLKSSGEIVLKGVQLTVQGTTVAVNASATLTLKGAQVMGG